MRINTQVICNMPTGTPVYGFRLTNSIGAVVELTNWGARWLSAIVPDKHGEMANVLVSPTDLLSELAGIKDIVSKSQGSNTPINIVRATFKGLEALRTVEQVAELRGKDKSEIK